MSIKLVAAAAVSVLSLVAPAMAQDSSLAAREIMNGSYSRAEQKLLTQLRSDARPEVLYEQVLQKDDVQMTVTTDRTAGSHAIAQAGLRYLSQRQHIASR